jgi:hypothetical protein
MKKNSILILSIFLILGFGYKCVSAQFPIKIPKIPKISTPKTDSTNSTQNIDNYNSSDTPPQDDIEENKNAPADYDANLKTGDMAVVIKGEDGHGFPEGARILGKSNGVYKVSLLKFSGTYWYKANSVYPYFDVEEFEMIRSSLNVISPYVQCYAQKHNLKVEQVGDYYDYNQGGEETKKSLEKDLPKFAELEAKMGKLQAHPNTFLEYANNPAIWWEIITQRSEYMQCVVNNAIAKNDIGRSKEFIDEALLEVEGYKTSRKIFSSQTAKLLFPAVSQRARAEWFKDSKSTQFKASFDPIFDKLAVAAAQTLPIYLPGEANFRFRDPVAERLLMNYFKNPSTVKILKIGLDSASWQIDKNSLGIPTSRYKDAYVYVRDTADDHPYCRRVSARIRQDYAGGGTYNTQTYRSSAEDELMGCPAGTK